MRQSTHTNHSRFFPAHVVGFWCAALFESVSDAFRFEDEFKKAAANSFFI